MYIVYSKRSIKRRQSHIEFMTMIIYNSIFNKMLSISPNWPKQLDAGFLGCFGILLDIIIMRKDFSCYSVKDVILCYSMKDRASQGSGFLWCNIKGLSQSRQMLNLSKFYPRFNLIFLFWYLVTFFKESMKGLNWICHEIFNLRDEILDIGVVTEINLGKTFSNQQTLPW